MHPANAFRIEAVEPLMEHLRRHPLVTLAAAPEGRVLMAQAPVLFRNLDGCPVLDFHLSSANVLAQHLAVGFHAVAVSLGAEAYVSPDWYVSEDQVPTWNYMSVEAEGPVAGLDHADLVALLDDLSAQEEAKLAPKRPWTRQKMSAGRFESMTRGIVGARLSVTRLEGTWKLSQNKADVDQEGVVLALGQHPLAGAMRALK